MTFVTSTGSTGSTGKLMDWKVGREIVVESDLPEQWNVLCWDGMAMNQMSTTDADEALC